MANGRSDGKTAYEFRVCSTCGVTFIVHASQMARGTGRVCSPECRRRKLAGVRKGEGNWKG